MLPRHLLAAFALPFFGCAFFGCAAPPGGGIEPASPTAPTSTAATPASAEPEVQPASPTTGARSIPSASPAVPSPKAFTSPPPSAVPSAAIPAPSSSAAASTPLTDQDKQVIAMCQGKANMFTDKELKLLHLADASPDAAMHEHAADIRKRRQDSLNEACARLKAEGKL